jgi:hypothetical protein
MNTGYVDNTDYLNSRDLLVPMKHDVGRQDSFGPNTIGIRVPRTKRLLNFIGTNRFKYAYDDRSGILLLNDAMSFSEYWNLRNLMSDDEQKKLVDDLYARSAALSSPAPDKAKPDTKLSYHSRKPYSREDAEFLQKNEMELVWQTMSRWVLHHHNFVLGPINEYALGKPLGHIYSQYGWPSIVVVKTLLDRMGGISYQNYFSVWFSFYIIYYLLFLAMLFLLLRKPAYILLCFMSVVTILDFIGFRILFLGPGLNPIRHFFDVFILCSVYFYLQKRRIGFLLIASALTFLAILNNVQTGLACLAALLATFGLLSLSNPRSFRSLHLFVLIATIAAGIFACLLGRSSFDPVSGYYLSGLSGFPMPRLWLSLALIGSCLAYFVLFKWLSSDESPTKYLAIFLTLYSQVLFVYCVWGGTINHVLNVSPIFLLTLVVFLRLIVQNGNRLKEYVPAIVSAGIVIFVLSGMYYYLDHHMYNGVFTQHKTFQWNMDRAKFESTMDPKYFENGVELINKYSKDENGIYILSRYDYFLPFLANKYSAMPFFDLQWFLLTQKEVQLCIDKINSAKPKYLFIDTDIERPLMSDVVSKHYATWDILYEESLMRVGRLEEVRKVYLAEKAVYEPIEKGYLITVYVRKETANNGPNMAVSGGTARNSSAE